MQRLTDFHTKYTLLANKTSSSEKVSFSDLPILFLPGTDLESQMRHLGAPTLFVPSLKHLVYLLRRV